MVVPWQGGVDISGFFCNCRSLKIAVVNHRWSQDLHAARRTAVLNGLASNFRTWKYVSYMAWGRTLVRNIGVFGRKTDDYRLKKNPRARKRQRGCTSCCLCSVHTRGRRLWQESLLGTKAVDGVAAAGQWFSKYHAGAFGGGVSAQENK